MKLVQFYIKLHKTPKKNGGGMTSNKDFSNFASKYFMSCSSNENDCKYLSPLLLAKYKTHSRAKSKLVATCIVNHNVASSCNRIKQEFKKIQSLLLLLTFLIV